MRSASARARGFVCKYKKCVGRVPTNVKCAEIDMNLSEVGLVRTTGTTKIFTNYFAFRNVAGDVRSYDSKSPASVAHVCSFTDHSLREEQVSSPV